MYQSSAGGAYQGTDEKGFGDFRVAQVTGDLEQQKTPLTILEQTKTSLFFFHNTKYYIQSDKGNVAINEVKCFEANSKETVSLYKVYNIDYDFQTGEYVNRLKDALPENDLSYIEKVKYVRTESPTGRELDQKKNLDTETLYLFDGKLYNKNEAGNIIWGGALRQMGFSKTETTVMAQGGTLILEKRLDEKHDQNAIKVGWSYQNQVIKDQNKKK